MTEPTPGPGGADPGHTADRRTGRSGERADRRRSGSNGGRSGRTGLLSSTDPRVFVSSALIVLVFVIGVFVTPTTTRDGE